MTSPSPSKPLSTLVALRGGYNEAIAPGGPAGAFAEQRIVTLLYGTGATWWEHDAPITVALPPHTPSDGARWIAPDKLRVGLGTLDLAARAWTADPAFAMYAIPGPRGEVPVRAAAWSPDASHVAMLVRDGSATQIVIAARDGRERKRREIAGATALAMHDDRILVASDKVTVLDLDAKVIAEVAPPSSPARLRDGAGTFAVVGAAGEVTLIRPADGVVLATWDVHAVDAVPVARGVIAVDLEGVVRVGCVDGAHVRQVAEVPSGAFGPVVQLVGERLVLAGKNGADPIRVATFTNPCS